MQGAGGVGGLLSETVNGLSTVNCFPTYDGNGNVSEYLFPYASIVAHYEYDPFGNTNSDSDNTYGLAYRFSTKPRDLKTGFYYYGYRYYDPLTGRWPSRDPIEESGGMNLYNPLYNNPISWVDVLENEPAAPSQSPAGWHAPPGSGGGLFIPTPSNNMIPSNTLPTTPRGTDPSGGRASLPAELAQESAIIARRGADNSAMQSAQTSCESLLANTSCKGAACPNSCDITFRRKFNPGGTPLGN